MFNPGLKLCNQQTTMSDYCRVLPIGTQQDSSTPLFLLWSDLFLRTSSSLFTCMYWTSLWY
jgi:hypothetical protein